MLLSARTARRAVAGALGAGALAGAMLFGALPIGVGAAATPPNCTAADSGRRCLRCLGVDVGVPVHASGRELRSSPASRASRATRSATDVQHYLDANPMVRPS